MSSGLWLLLLLAIGVVLWATRGLGSSINTVTVSILAANFQLNSNSYLKSGDYYLLLQEDCDLVLYQKMQARARSGSFTAGGNCGLAMQADGNLVLYNATGPDFGNISYAEWSSGSLTSVRKFSYYLLLQSSGELGVYDADKDSAPLPFPNPLEPVGADFQPPANLSQMLADPDHQFAWQAPSLTVVHSYMYVGYMLSEGQKMASMSGRFSLVMGTDCNVKVSDDKPGFNRLVWQTGTEKAFKRGPCQLTLQADGRLLVLGKSLDLVWNSSSNSSVSGNGSVNWVLNVDDYSGNLVIRDLLNQDDAALWSAAPVDGSPAAGGPGPGLPASPTTEPGGTSASPPMSPAGSSSSRNSVTQSTIFRAIVGACIGGVFLLGMAVFVLVYHSRRQQIDPAAKELQRRIMNGGRATQALTLEKISQATNGFSMKIGRGGFGDVFYGKLEDGQEVAVKVLSETSHQSKEEFYNEIELLSMVHHKYLVSLLGYCLEKNHPMLVYEYVKEGDLRKRLKGEKSRANALTWDQRRSIILQVAEGLEYLHDKCCPSIIHRDVKSNNILLTEKLVAKVADFGLSKLRPIDQESASHVTTAVRGTRGYFDPQYFETGMLTDRSDVFAFGIVVMEIITGQNQTSLAPRVFESWKTETSLKLADPNLYGELDETEYMRLVNLSLWCVKKKSSDRPSMAQVAHKLRTLFSECQYMSQYLVDVDIQENEFDFSSQ